MVRVGGGVWCWIAWAESAIHSGLSGGRILEGQIRVRSRSLLCMYAVFSSLTSSSLLLSPLRHSLLLASPLDQEHSDSPPPTPRPHPLFIPHQRHAKLPGRNHWSPEFFALHETAFPAPDDDPAAYFAEIRHFGCVDFAHDKV